MKQGRPRGTRTRIPEWWMKAVRDAMKSKSLDRVAIAEKYARSRAGGQFKNAGVRVYRFFDDEKPIRTIEFATWLAELLELPPYEFRAHSLEEARAMDAAQKDPQRVARALAIQTLSEGLKPAEAMDMLPIPSITERRRSR